MASGTFNSATSSTAVCSLFVFVLPKGPQALDFSGLGPKLDVLKVSLSGRFSARLGVQPNIQAKLSACRFPLDCSDFLRIEVSELGEPALTLRANLVNPTGLRGVQKAD